MKFPHDLEMIRLWTGYAIEYSEHWEDHLVAALIGECLTKAPPKATISQKLRVLHLETERVSIIYGIDYEELKAAVEETIDKRVVDSSTKHSQEVASMIKQIRNHEFN